MRVSGKRRWRRPVSGLLDKEFEELLKAQVAITIEVVALAEGAASKQFVPTPWVAERLSNVSALD